MLVLLAATEQDAPRIADIHMAAFGSNELLQAQFPTPSVREGLRAAIVKKAIDDIRDPHTAVLLVQDTHCDRNSSNNDTIISFAKWSLPLSTTENEAAWKWPEGTRMDLIDRWNEKIEEAKREVCDRACYRTLVFRFFVYCFFGRSRGGESPMVCLISKVSWKTFLIGAPRSVLHWNSPRPRGTRCCHNAYAMGHPEMP